MDQHFLKALEKKAQEDHIPIISWTVAELLYFLGQANHAQRILEIGTAVGYSTIWLATAETVTHVTTIEIDAERQKEAKKNLLQAGLQEKVTFCLGDAHALLPELQATYDLIFLDSAKGQYVRLLPECLRLLRPGGVLVTDNVHFRGMVEGQVPVEKRYKTIVNRLRAYLAAVQDHPELVTVVLPIGDGVALSYKKEVSGS